MMADDAVWNAVRSGDRTAFTDMYKTYYQFLFVSGFKKCANRELAKDCIHEMFLEIWKKKSELPQVQHVGFYLRTYLIRKILRELPKELHFNIDVKEEQNSTEVEYSYEDLMIQLQSKEEMKQRVQRAIHQLSKRELEIIRMKFFENKSYDEIAVLTTTTPRTIYNHVYNALKVLRKSLNMFLATVF